MAVCSWRSGRDHGRARSIYVGSALLARPGNDEIQLDLSLDYASNIALYPTFQEYFRTRRPPLLAVWGKNDPFFLPLGANAFNRDIPSHDSERITEHINDEHQPQRTRDRNDEQKACPWSQLALPGLLRRGPMVHLPVRNAAGSQIVLAVPVVYLSTGVPR